MGIACTALVWQVTTLLLVAPPCGGGGVSRAAELTGGGCGAVLNDAN